MNFKLIIVIVISIIILSNNNLISKEPDNKVAQDSINKAKVLMQEAKVKSARKNIEITIRNVDITKFPIIKVIVEANSTSGEPLDTLYSDQLSVLENGIEKKVISVQKISINERVPVDFVFMIDKTGSMQSSIDAVKKNISRFISYLVHRGIDYRIGLILFSDIIDRIYQPTDNVLDFLNWLSPVKAEGGGDEKENALEALKSACEDINYRKSANKVGVIITDAPYHQQGEHGDGTTNLTTNTAIKMLLNNDLRLFAIVPESLKNYQTIVQKTRGSFYDMDYPFSTILDRFSDQLTNIYALTYKTEEEAIPDSINIELLDKDKKTLTRKTIPILELGRKLIIENLLYETNSAILADSVPELDILTQFMKNKPSVVILVEGHTDNVGKERLNDMLSLRRSESVKAYLMKKGIDERRILTKGFGKNKPIADNKTEFGRRLNRRTEIVIVSK